MSMSEPPEPPRPTRGSSHSARSTSSNGAIAYLHLWILTTLALVQPLLDVLTRYPEYFLAQKLDFPTVAWASLGLWLIAPVPLILIRFALSAIAQRTASSSATDSDFPPTATFDTCVVALAGVTVVFQAGHTSFLAPLNVPALVVVAALLGMGIGWIWQRYPVFHSFVTYLSPALIAVPALFLFDPAIQALRESPKRVEPIPADAVADVPVVLVIFDALSATAVMNVDRDVNAVRFPHLAALADDSLWFRNATTVAGWTNHALPAILTGRLPAADRLPGWRHRPETLFTALAASHRIFAAEPMFQHCPPETNLLLGSTDSGWTRLESTATDLWMVYLHRTLPRALTVSLPPIDEGWGGFKNSSSEQRRTEPLYRLLDAMEAPRQATGETIQKPPLYFAHVIFPHMPYLHLPSGKIFQLRPDPHPTFGLLRDGKPPDLESQIFIYKRYLFQVGHVDQMVGDLVDRLRETGLYDDALVILTSDHGGRSGPRVGGVDSSVIPLLIKLPRSSESGTRDERVSNLDVVPTVLDVLGAPTPWPMDGRSIFAAGYQPPRQYFDQKQLAEMDDDFWFTSQNTLDFKAEYFGLGDDPLQLYRAGSPRPEMLGRPVDSFHLEPVADVRAELDEGGPTLDVDSTSDYVPVLLRGSLFLDADPGDRTKPPQVAVSLNGVVEAVVTTWFHEEPDWYRFRVTIPETAYRPGPNEVRVWRVDPSRDDRLFGPL